MKMIIDTREQNPLVFKNSMITECVVETLCVGDYCVEFKDGCRPPIVFERKAIGDLFGTMGKGHERFKREIERCQQHNITMILIVEGGLHKVEDGFKHSKVGGITVVRKMFTLWIKYGIIPVFTKDRAEMVEYIEQFYIACGKEHMRKKG